MTAIVVLAALALVAALSWLVGNLGRVALRALVGCSHVDTYRERRNGVYLLVCRDCDQSVPVIRREPGFHRSGDVRPVITRTPKVPATVTHLHRFQQRVK